MKNQTPRSSTLRCFNDLNSHLSQSAEKGTSWKQNQGKLAITKLFHFMKMAWLFVRLLAHSGSLNLSFIPLEWWKTGWEGWQGRETNPWPSKPHLWLGMESGLAFPEKTVWLCWEKKPVQTVAMILYFAHAPACSSAVKHHALEEKTRCFLSLALTVWTRRRSHVLPCSSNTLNLRKTALL